MPRFPLRVLLHLRAGCKYAYLAPLHLSIPYENEVTIRATLVKQFHIFYGGQASANLQYCIYSCMETDRRSMTMTVPSRRTRLEDLLYRPYVCGTKGRAWPKRRC